MFGRQSDISFHLPLIIKCIGTQGEWWEGFLATGLIWMCIRDSWQSGGNGLRNSLPCHILAYLQDRPTPHLFYIQTASAIQNKIKNQLRQLCAHVIHNKLTSHMGSFWKMSARNPSELHSGNSNKQINTLISNTYRGEMHNTASFARSSSASVLGDLWI